LNRRGFTVIEILVALLLFSIGALALVKMQVGSIKGSGFNKETASAITLAQKKMEQLKNGTYPSVTSNATGVTDQIAGITYTTTWVSNETGSAPTRYKTVAVTVTWGTKSITINTIISEV
jgi:type II secretion system protein I